MSIYEELTLKAEIAEEAGTDLFHRGYPDFVISSAGTRATTIREVRDELPIEVLQEMA